METIFTNIENSKSNEPHIFRLSLVDKFNHKNSNGNIALGNSNVYYTWKNIKSAYNNNKFIVSAPAWNDTFDLPDGYNSVEDIQDYMKNKKHETLTKNAPVEIYLNKIKTRVDFKIKTGFKLELLSPKTMKLLGSTKKDVDQDKTGLDVPKLECVEVFLVHCNLVNNNYQQA